MILDQEELQEITQCWSARAKIDWLTSRGIPFGIKPKDGTPIVLRKVFDELKYTIAHPTILDPYNECLKQQISFTRKCIGIYCLFNNGKLVYIGKTTTFFVRMAAHDKGDYEWDNVVFVPLEKSKIDLYEAELIARHNPIYNKILRTDYVPQSEIGGA